MRAFVFASVVLVSFSAFAELSCEDSVLSTRLRLEAALDHVFERTDAIKADPTFAKLDRHLVEWLEDELGRQTARAAENLLRILNEAWVLDRFFPERFGADFWKGTSGLVSYRENYVRLIMNRGLLESEVSRHVFVHEVTHLLGGGLDARSLAAVSKQARRARARRLSIYRGEIASYRAEYRWLQSNYAARDLVRLARLGRDYGSLREVLMRKPWAKFEDTHLSPDFELVGGDEDWALIRAFVKAEGDALLLMAALDARNTSEPEFVKKRVILYKKDQEYMERYVVTKRRIRWGAAGALAGSVTPVVVRWLFGP